MHASACGQQSSRKRIWPKTHDAMISFFLRTVFTECLKPLEVSGEADDELRRRSIALSNLSKARDPTRHDTNAMDQNAMLSLLDELDSDSVALDLFIGVTQQVQIANETIILQPRWSRLLKFPKAYKHV